MKTKEEDTTMKRVEKDFTRHNWKDFKFDKFDFHTDKSEEKWMEYIKKRYAVHIIEPSYEIMLRELFEGWGDKKDDLIDEYRSDCENFSESFYEFCIIDFEHIHYDHLWQGDYYEDIFEEKMFNNLYIHKKGEFTDEQLDRIYFLNGAVFYCDKKYYLVFNFGEEHCHKTEEKFFKDFYNEDLDLGPKIKDEHYEPYSNDE